MSAAVALAHEAEYEVTGCDIKIDSPYTEKLQRLGVQIC